MSTPLLSVVIPVYNRHDLIRHTLNSVRGASSGLSVEVIVVDDGSNPPISESLARIGFRPERLIRQRNQGLLFGRLAGLEAATGEYTLFLDSDDLVAPEKFHRQLAAMKSEKADVSYTDSARVVVSDRGAEGAPAPSAAALATADPAEFYISVQPPPHSPIFRTAYLTKIVADALFPPSRLYNSVAEIWFYYNAAPRPGRVVYVPGALTIVGMHPGPRLTNHWEKLGCAALAVLEAFVRTCPAGPEAGPARRLTAAAAFRAWRALPEDFSPEFRDRMLGVWKKLDPGGTTARGGGGFQLLARVLGPVAAANLLARRRPRPYEKTRTMTDEEFLRLLRELPNP